MRRKAAPSPKKRRPAVLQPGDREQRSLAAVTKTPAIVDPAGLISDLRSLIQSARQRIATVAYSTQTVLGWHVGRRLSTENLQDGRAAYGKQILVTVSRELTAEYGRGFSYAEMCRIERWDVRTLSWLLTRNVVARNRSTMEPESTSSVKSSGRRRVSSIKIR